MARAPIRSRTWYQMNEDDNKEEPIVTVVVQWYNGDVSDEEENVAVEDFE